MWHNQGVSEDGPGRRRTARGRRAPAPLDAGRLQELALRYVSRFATTRAKLETFLRRKLRERGWAGDREPDLEAIGAKFVALGYIDDAAFARAKAGALVGRGYGAGRLRQALTVAGVSDEDSAEAREVARSGSVEAALRFARRRRIGPFAPAPLDAPAREKALAAMLRAGHSLALAKRVVDTPPGEEVDSDGY